MRFFDYRFYIAKYEAGLDTIISPAYNPEWNTLGYEPEDAKPLSQGGKTAWYVYGWNAEPIAKLMITDSEGYASSLISAACWDTTLQWIKQTTGSNYDVDATGMGNYSENVAQTGYYSINGIYDMAGNMSEWTTEYVPGDPEYGDGISYRGGSYGLTYYTGDISAGRRNNTNGYDGHEGFRVVLYKICQ